METEATEVPAMGPEVPAGATVLCRSMLRVEQPRVGPCCSERSSASGLGLSVARAGEWALLELALCDAEGRACTDCGKLCVSLQPASLAGVEAPSENAPPPQPLVEQEVIAAAAGKYRLRYRVNLAGGYVLRVHVPGVSEAIADVVRGPTEAVAAPEMVVLGPWSLAALPAALCLAACIRRTQLPSTIKLGDAFRAVLPLVDRFGNPVTQLSRPPVGLCAWLVRVPNSPLSKGPSNSRVVKVSARGSFIFGISV